MKYDSHKLLRKIDFDSLNFEVLESTINILISDYPNGFTFDATAVRLLSDKSGGDINDNIQSILKFVLFRRGDDVYFMPDLVASAETREKIIGVANIFLDDYGCFEISELYDLLINDLNKKCIDSLENFESFYEFIYGKLSAADDKRRNIRCVSACGTRIARVRGKNIQDLFSDIAKRVISIANHEYSGVVSEHDLRKRFPAFSVTLLANIIKGYSEELVKTEINGIVCYQTLDALGLSDEFSNILAETLSQLDELGLTPSEDVLHTALSIRLGVNFKAEYNIPDDKTYRRLLVAYYNGAPKREWKRGVFAKTPD